MVKRAVLSDKGATQMKISRLREATVLRESRDGQRWVILWDGNKYPDSMIKSFLTVKEVEEEK